METEICVKVDPYEVVGELCENDLLRLLMDTMDGLNPKQFNEVMVCLDKEAVLWSFTAEDICDYADEGELVDELTRRGWKLVEEDE